MDAGTIIGGVIDSLETGLTAVATPALVLAGSVLALTVGYKFVKRFVG